jgi:hypothetical protein
VRVLAGLVLVALTSACAGPPPAPIAGPDPSDPSARAKAVGYRSTLAPYDSQRPVEPKPWLEQNQQVAPAPRPSDRP